MRHKLSLVLTLCAWLLATGSHWDVVQTFAWGRMIATYSESMSFTQAVQKTFSAGATCSVCEIVATAKSQDSAHPTTPTAPGKTLEKIHLVFAPAPAAPLLISSASFSWSLSDQTVPVSSRAAPLVPPPASPGLDFPSVAPGIPPAYVPRRLPHSATSSAPAPPEPGEFLTAPKVASYRSHVPYFRIIHPTPNLPSAQFCDPRLETIVP